MAKEYHLKISDIVPPFDFDFFIGLYASYTFPELVDVVRDGRYYRVLDIDGKAILAIISSLGTIETPQLNVELYSESDITSHNADEVSDKLRWMMGLDDDLTDFYESIHQKDRVLSRFVERLIGLKAPATPSVFEAFVHVIIEQQISFNFAGVVKSRIVEAFGNTVGHRGETYYAFPSPENLSKASVLDLRELKTSTRKAEYIIDVAKQIVDGKLDLEKSIGFSNEQVIERMTRIRGIGTWTAEMMMVRGMRKLDAVPADDIALRRLIGHYYFDNKKISGDEARQLGEDLWGVYCGYASFYLMYGGRIEKFLK